MTQPVKNDQGAAQSTPELLPCPFCGSADVELRGSLTDSGRYKQVACNNCGCRTGLVFLCADEASNAARKREAIAAWNARTTPDRNAVLEEAAKVAEDQAQRCRDIIATCPKWSPVQGEWSRARDACLDTADAIRALMTTTPEPKP